MQRHKIGGYATGYIIMFVVVIIFAVMLSGGSKSLLSGNHASPDYSDDVSPSPTASPSATWTLEYIKGECSQSKGGIQLGSIKAQGNTAGYLVLEIENSPGQYINKGNAVFNSPQTPLSLALLRSEGFNTKRWRVNLYSGGSKSGTTFSGGILQKTYDGDPTNC